MPCDTQSAERYVKLTTEPAPAAVGANRQDGHSLNKIAFRGLFYSEIRLGEVVSKICIVLRQNGAHGSQRSVENGSR